MSFLAPCPHLFAALAVLPPADPSLLSRLSPLSRRAVLATGVGGAAGFAAGLPAPALADSSAVYRPAPGSLAGTTVLITGANTGLGLESAKHGGRRLDGSLGDTQRRGRTAWLVGGWRLAAQTSW